MENNHNYGFYGQETPPYPEYRPYGGQGENPFMRELAPVTPAERTLLKKHYAVTFTELIIYSLGSFAAAQLVFIIMELCGYTFRTNAEGVQLFDVPYNIAASLVPAVFAIGLYIFDRCVWGKDMPPYFETKKITLGGIAAFLGMMMLAYSVATAVQQAVIMVMFSTGVSPVSERYMTDTDKSMEFLICDMILTAIVAPVAEELFFRGVVLRRLCCVSQKMGIFVTAAIFGLMHGNLPQAIIGFIVGLVLCYAAVRTGSLILPIIGHMMVNSIAVAYSFAEYFTDEEMAYKYWMAVLAVCFVLGLAALGVLMIKGGIHFPKSSEYHRKRTFPIMLTCVSFWIVAVMYIVSIASKFGPVTDKLLE